MTMIKLRLSKIDRLTIETGRYMRPYKKPNERICPLCKKEAEDEKHFLISCSVYQEKRKSLFECLSKKFKLPMKTPSENVDRKYNFATTESSPVIMLSYRK